MEAAHGFEFQFHHFQLGEEFIQLSVFVLELEDVGGFDAAALGLDGEALAAGVEDLGEGKGEGRAGLALEVVADAGGREVVHPLTRGGIVEFGEGGGDLRRLVGAEGSLEFDGGW